MGDSVCSSINFTSGGIVTQMSRFSYSFLRGDGKINWCLAHSFKYYKMLSSRARRNRAQESTHFVSLCSQFSAKILRLRFASLRMIAFLNCLKLCHKQQRSALIPNDSRHCSIFLHFANCVVNCSLKISVRLRYVHYRYKSHSVSQILCEHRVRRICIL